MIQEVGSVKTTLARGQVEPSVGKVHPSRYSVEGIETSPLFQNLGIASHLPSLSFRSSKAAATISSL